MKVLLIIPLFLSLLLSPMILDSVYADHVTGASQTYTDTWHVKEIDNTYGECNTAKYELGLGFIIRTTASGTGKYCSIFKVFDTVDVDGKEHSGSVIGSRVGGGANYARAWIYDGSYSGTNSTDFPEDAMIPTKGAGLLFTNAGAGASITMPYTPDLSSSTQSQVTNFQIVLEDSAGSPYQTAGYMRYLTIEDLGTWHFTGAFGTSTTDATNSNWDIEAISTGSFDDYWTYKSFDPVAVDTPTALSISSITDTGATITWTDPVNQTSSTQQPDINDIHIQIQNGTNSNGDSYYWKALTRVDAGVETYAFTGGEAGHTYSVRLIADGLGYFSDPTTPVTFTHTGSEAVAQTMRPVIETYADVGITDNSFYAIEYYTDGFSGNNLGPSSVDQGDGGGNCDAINDLLANRGWALGYDGTTWGQCTGHVKTFPVELVDGVLWEVGDSNQRTVDPVYYRLNVYDGNFGDVMDTTVWKQAIQQNFSEDSGTTFTFTTGAGLLSSQVSIAYADFTPDYSSATTGFVTMINSIEDYDPVNGDNASSGIFHLKIDGKYIFFFPQSTGTGYEIENLIDDSNHDVYRLSTFTPPKTPSSATGVKDGNTADISYTVPSFNGGSDIVGMNVYRYCSDVDSDYTDLGQFPGVTGGSFTDNLFQQTLDSVTLGVTPYYSYDFSTQGTPDPTWADNIYYDVNLTTEVLDWNTKADNTSDVARANPVDIMGDTWLIEFDILFDAVGTKGANAMYIGGTSSVSSNVGNIALDFMGISFEQTAGDRTIYATSKDGSTFTKNAFDYKQAVGDKVWVSIERIDATHFAVSLFNAETRQAEDLIETSGSIELTGTYSNIITQIISNHNQNVVEGVDSGEIDNWNVWYGQDLADVSHTPVYSDSANGSCVYKLSAYNFYGTSLNATSSAVTVGDPNAPTFSAITDHQALASWSISGETDVTGYALEYSFDDSTWINLIANTSPDTSTNHEITGIDHTTTVYVRWADVIGGIVQTYSSSGSFTTLGVQAGGGGPGPTVKTVIAPEDLTPEFIPPEPKKGLTALDIFAKNVERIAPGETKRATLSITWEGDSNLRVEEIIVDESTGLKFAFTQPIEFPPSSTGKQTSSIPYVIEAPALLCTTEQSAKCVYNDATYELPTQVFATSNGESIKFNSVLTINVTDDFNLGMQEIFLGILALVIIAIIIGKTKKTNKRSKVINRSKRPKLR